jgi:hypothetical protein
MLRPLPQWVAKSAGASRRVTVHEAWVEMPLDDKWMTAYRLIAADHGEPVVGEIRVFPRESLNGRPPGNWTAELLGVHASVPQGGIPGDLLRHVRLGVTKEFGPAFSRWFKGAPRRGTAQRPRGKRSQSVPAATPPKRGRPTDRGDRFYAQLASDYMKALSGGNGNPVAVVARERSLEQAQVRDMVHQARKRGFLSGTRRGRSGGHLTAKALDALRSRSRR